MTLLNLVGLISLLSIVAYFILYFIKPNYQQKYVSSTFIWKLSLKYRKKRIPINKLRNLLLVLIQILLLMILTLIIVKPVIITREQIENEAILVIDASASMRTTDDLETRFERAVNLAKRKANEVLTKEGLVTVVVSDNDPYMLAERFTLEDLSKLNDAFDELIVEKEKKCSYGKTDINKAISLCTDILYENSNASIYVYSDITADYVDKGINLINVRDASEYNIAITNAYSELLDNYYLFNVEVVSYNMDESILLTLEVSGANKDEANPYGSVFKYEQNIDLINDTHVKVVFLNSEVDTTLLEDTPNVVYVEIPSDEKVVSYDTIHVSTNTDDSFKYDNSFDIYGGSKEIINVLYASADPNSFFRGVILGLKAAYSNRYTIALTTIRDGEVPNSGYDLYIYEHELMPKTHPTDGIVLYADPLVSVTGAGFTPTRISDFSKQSKELKEEESHPITEDLDIENITISRMILVSGVSNYQTLMSVDGKPAVMISDDESFKSIVLLFSLHYSNLPIIKEFPLLMINIFDYFLPQTVSSNSFEINDSVEIKSRGNSVEVKGAESTITLEEFPNSVSLTVPGTYEISQTSVFGKDIKDDIYVRIPAEESNILLNVESIVNPVNQMTLEDIYKDLLLWLSIALVSVLFLEWLLKGKDTL